MKPLLPAFALPDRRPRTSRRRAWGGRAWTRWTQALLFLYGLAFIWNTSFVIGGSRFFCLFDDAMVSMRYARNCAQGFGLVWNAGQAPVEGYTNFLWTLLMVPWHLLRLPLNLVCLPVQLTGLLCLVLTLEAVRRVASRVSGAGGPALVFALLCSAFYLPLVNWSLQGMETGLLALLFTLACASALDDLAGARFGPAPYVWLLIATLVRVDALFLLCGTGLLLAALDPAHRRGRLLAALGLTLGMAVLQAGVRLWYYHAPLPNTYYLKMTGFPAALRMLRGAKVGGDFILSLSWVLPLVLFAFLAFRREMRSALLPFGMFLLAFFYSVYVGGDAWEFWGGSNRFISPLMPLFFVCAGHALDRLAGRRRWGGGPWPRVLAAAAAVLALAGVTPRPGVLLLRKKALYVLDNAALVQRGLAIRNRTLPSAEVAVVSAGSIAYFSGRPCVDLLGKSDPYIARLPMHADLKRPLDERFFPGHLKWDYAYSIGRLKPDVIAQVGPDGQDDFYPQLKGYGRAQGMLYRIGSPNVLWTSVGPLAPIGTPASGG